MKTFSALLALCAGNSSVTCAFPAQRPVTRSFDVFSDLRLNKQLCKQSWGRWFESPSRSLWRHCNDANIILLCQGQNVDWANRRKWPIFGLISSNKYTQTLVFGHLILKSLTKNVANGSGVVMTNASYIAWIKEGCLWTLLNYCRKRYISMQC